MEQQPDISVITVNYNGIKDTSEMIVSLQSHVLISTCEIIVVDNGSRQDEADILQKRFPLIRTIRSEKNLGFAGGNNLGIKQAKGKFIFLLNNDTIIENDDLHYLCETLSQYPEVGAVSPKIKFAAPPRNIQYAGFTPLSRYTLRNRSIGYDESDQGQYNTPGFTAFLHGAAMMIKRETIERIGLMPEIYFLYYEEMDWCTRMISQGYKLWFDPRCTIYHKESSTTGQESPLKTYYLTRNRLLYAVRNRKGFIRVTALFYQLIFANPKNIIVNLFKRKTKQIKAILKGCLDFFTLKNKYYNRGYNGDCLFD